MVRSMVSGDHDFEADLTRAAREQAELDKRQHAEAVTPVEQCHFGWHDGKSGHVCRGREKGHAEPHKCTYCGAVSKT